MDGNSWLDKLPTEVLLKIFNYIDTETVHDSLILVCHRFHLILSDSFFWREKFAEKYRDKHVIRFVDLPAEFCWRRFYYESYKRDAIWRTHTENNYRNVMLGGVHYAGVDAVHLIENGSKCLSGARDRGLAVWDVTAALDTMEVNPSPYQLCSKPDAHAGWIWAITSLGKNIYSSSWDNTIKLWSLDNGALQERNIFRLLQPVLAMSINEGVLVAGLWGNITVFDPRIGMQSSYQYNAHNRAILDVAIHGNYIISASEDRTVAVYDMRAKKPVTVFGLKGNAASPGFPRKIAAKPNLVYVGDTKGNVHFVHPNQFTVLASHPVSAKSITGICVEDGVLVVSSLECNVRIFTPTSPLEEIVTLQCSTGDCHTLDYNNDVLAVGGSDSSIHLWVSKQSSALTQHRHNE